MKEKLYFKPDGTLRVLMISDIQEVVSCDPRSPKCYRELVVQTKPDLIIWGGDNIDGRKMKTADELRAYLDIFASINEEAGIPWMHVFGNHDYDMDISPCEQSAIYAEYPHCISGISPENVPGVTNYVIPIYSVSSEKPAYAIYAFDSMHKEAELRPGVSFESMKLANRPAVNRKWEPLRFEQLMWYWNTSKQLEAEAGKQIKALAVMHVPPHEISMITDNPDDCGTQGFWDEAIQCGIVNSGFFAAALERGDVECIASGHLHRDTVEGTYAGIRMCLDACAGFRPGGFDDRRGGRIFEITEYGIAETKMIPYSSFMSVEKESE